jgi:hypothetical protein
MPTFLDGRTNNAAKGLSVLISPNKFKANRVNWIYVPYLSLLSFLPQLLINRFIDRIAVFVHVHKLSQEFSNVGITKLVVELIKASIISLGITNNSLLSDKE